MFYGQTSPNLTFFLEIMDAVSSGLMRREMRKGTFQAFSSKVIISNGMRGHMCTRGSLHVLEGTMNAIRYIKNLDQHMLLSRWHLFQGRPNPNPNNAKPLTAAITTAWLHSRRVPSPLENIWRIIKRKIRQRRPQTLQQLEIYIRQEWDQIPTQSSRNS